MLDVGVNPATGTRKQKKKGGFATKGEAQEAAALLVAELAQGLHIEEKSTTFEAFSEEWLMLYSGTGKVKVSTLRVRRHELDKLMPFFAKLKMKDVTKQQYQTALNKLKAKGFADNTLDGIHRTGRMVFKKALELDVIKTDPTAFAYVPKVQKTVEQIEQAEAVVKYLEKEELALFLRTAKDEGRDRDYAIFMTLAYTGMRAGELCALKWKDVDFEEHSITISKTYYNPTNNIRSYQILTPKTASANRSIEVDVAVIRELEKLRQAQERLKYGKSNYHDKDFVFAKTGNSAGYPEYIKIIENRMRRLLQLAGLNPSLTPHSLRHTHTSLLAEAGVELHDIMDRLGHKDDDTTRNIYMHVTKTKKKEAVQKFSELMNSF
nr:site-specific integrase [Paenibacillus sp. sptzw28]